MNNITLKLRNIDYHRKTVICILLYNIPTYKLF